MHVIAQAVHCTKPGCAIHIDCDVNCALLELIKFLECQPCPRVTKEPQMREEDSLASGAHALLAAISLVQILVGQGYLPQDRDCEPLLL